MRQGSAKKMTKEACDRPSLQFFVTVHFGAEWYFTAHASCTGYVWVIVEEKMRSEDGWGGLESIKEHE
uniref:Uncharacterized protein n=1 Tax=Setaria digitata TaxID=48799 RepID=A0A915PRR0_9BILA